MIVFDLDDTLYLEIDYVHSGYRAIGCELQRLELMEACDAVALLMASETMAIGLDRLEERLSHLHPGCGFDIARMLQLYRFHKPEIKLRDGVQEVLDILWERGIPMGIITDGRSSTQRAKIEALGLDRYVADGNVIISEEIGADKTTELPFATMVARNPGEQSFLYLGDNPAKDFLWPNKMGWVTVEIIDSEGVHIHRQDLVLPAEFQAGHEIAAVSELLRFVQ